MPTPRRTHARSSPASPARHGAGSGTTLGAGRRPVAGLALMLAGAAALVAVVAMVRRLPVDLAPIGGSELREVVEGLPEGLGRVVALRHAEGLLLGLGLAAAVFVLVLGLLAWRRARMTRRMHVFGKRVA